MPCHEQVRITKKNDQDKHTPDSETTPISPAIKPLDTSIGVCECGGGEDYMPKLLCQQHFRNCRVYMRVPHARTRAHTHALSLFLFLSLSLSRAVCVSLSCPNPLPSPHARAHSTHCNTPQDRLQHTYILTPQHT